MCQASSTTSLPQRPPGVFGCKFQQMSRVNTLVGNLPPLLFGVYQMTHSRDIASLLDVLGSSVQFHFLAHRAQLSSASLRGTATSLVVGFLCYPGEAPALYTADLPSFALLSFGLRSWAFSLFRAFVSIFERLVSRKVFYHNEKDCL